MLVKKESAKEKPMFGLSLGHLIVISIIVLLFGSRRLPELGSALGRGMNAFKKGLNGEEDLHPSLGHDEQGVKEPDVILASNAGKDQKKS
jgi:sec-independent protein translocase protein TatA